MKKYLTRFTIVILVILNFAFCVLSIFEKNKYSFLILDKNTIEIPDNGETSNIEKNRFNSQFEFFVSENLTSDNIKELLKTLENNLEDANILTKSGDIEDLDVEKLDSSYEGSEEYQKNIDEILFYIK